MQFGLFSFPSRVFPFRCMIHICINDTETDFCEQAFFFLLHTLSLTLSLFRCALCCSGTKMKIFKKLLSRRKVLRERTKNYYKHKKTKNLHLTTPHTHAALFTLRTLSYINHIKSHWFCLKMFSRFFSFFAVGNRRQVAWLTKKIKQSCLN